MKEFKTIINDLKKEKGVAIDEKNKHIIELKNSLEEYKVTAEKFERKFKASEQDTAKIDNLKKEFEAKIEDMKSAHLYEKYKILDLIK